MFRSSLPPTFPHLHNAGGFAHSVVRPTTFPFVPEVTPIIALAAKTRSAVRPACSVSYRCCRRQIEGHRIYIYIYIYLSLYIYIYIHGETFTTGVCEKNAPLRKIIGHWDVSFRSTKSGAGEQFCCQAAGKRLVQEECFFTDTGVQVRQKHAPANDTETQVTC